MIKIELNREMTFQSFHDEEAQLDYADNIFDVEPLKAFCKLIYH